MKPEENFSTGTRIFCHEDAKTQSFTKILCPAVLVDKVKLTIFFKSKPLYNWQLGLL